VGKKAERNKLDHTHFSRWIDWAKEQKIGLDFNPTFFAHPKADSGFTLSSADKSVRKFWVEHAIACRTIAARFGKELKTPSVNNLWIPDGYKDVPADRAAPRARLAKSLDEIYGADISQKDCIDALEGKLFGLGSESYVTGSFEFYYGYAVKNKKVLTLDSGHFHPTEQIADKLSAVFCFLDRVLLHVSRGIRWDSDHVTIFSDDLRDMMLELVRGDYLSRTFIATDYFDASINRIAAWVIGGRAVLKALLFALCEPYGLIAKCEKNNDFTGRLALMEETKTLPLGAVWDYYCETNNVPTGKAWIEEVRKYEKSVLMKRV
jgi:L-rhamnose isomerase